MGGDGVVECYKLQDSDRVNVASSFNVRNAKYNQRNSDPLLGLRRSSLYGSWDAENSIIRCRFSRQATANTDRVPPLDRPYYILGARGPVGETGRLSIHDLSVLPVISDDSIDFSRITGLSAQTERPLGPVTRPEDFQQRLPSPVRDNNAVASAPSVASSGPIDTSACGQSKGCFMSPNDCKGEATCNFLLTFGENERDPNLIDFEMSGRMSTEKTFQDRNGQVGVWIAFGLSTDSKMGRDSVVECYKPENSDRVFIATSFNPGKFNARNSPPTIGLQEQSLSGGWDAQTSVLRCRFSRYKIVSSPSVYNLTENTPYHILGARGPLNPDNTIGVHDFQVLPVASDDPVDLNSLTLATSRAKNLTPYRTAHALMMILAWIGLVSVAIITARYYKETWGDETLLGQKVWFTIHRTCNLTAVCLMIVAIIIIFVSVEGWVSAPAKSSTYYHAICGITAFALALTQPIMAMFRCHPGTKHRPVFNWTHWPVGTAAHILAVVTIYFSIKMGAVNLPDYVYWIVTAYVVWHVCVEILLEVNACASKKNRVNNETELMTVNHGQFRVEVQRKEPPGSLFQQCLLAVYAFVVFVLVIVLMVLVALNFNGVDISSR